MSFCLKWQRCKEGYGKSMRKRVYAEKCQSLPWPFKGEDGGRQWRRKHQETALTVSNLSGDTFKIYLCAAEEVILRGEGGTSVQYRPGGKESKRSRQWRGKKAIWRRRGGKQIKVGTKKPATVMDPNWRVSAKVCKWESRCILGTR